MGDPVVRVCETVEVAQDRTLLSPAERQRWQRLVDTADRAAYLAAHVLVRTVAAELGGLRAGDIVLTHLCPTCGGTDHGQPVVEGRPDLHVSLSHIRGTVAAIAAHAPCGIDVEAMRSSVPDSALTDAELAWAGRDPLRRTRLWTRKEAWAKAAGHTLDRVAAEDVVDPPWLSGETHTDRYAAAWVVL